MTRSSATGPDAFTGATPDNALRDADRAEMVAADGTPLKRSLNRALRAQKLRALALIAPLLIFVLVTFVAPIVDMLFRSVENDIVSENLPRTVQALQDWDGTGTPDEEAFRALGADFVVASERRNHTRVGSRLNYETTGISSLFRQTGRDVDEIGEIYTDQFVELNEAWEDPATWMTLMASEDWLDEREDWLAAEAEAEAAQEAAETRDERRALRFEDPEPAFELSDLATDALPRTAAIYDDFARVIQVEDEDSPAEEEPWNIVYQALYEDLSAGRGEGYEGEAASLLSAAREAVPGFETMSVRDFFLEEIDEDWADPEIWGTIKAFSDPYTAGYFLTAVDLRLTPDGIERQPEGQQIYILLFERTLFMSLMIMGSCVLLGYPIAFLLSNLPMRTSNLLLILVLLPFWTSLLVRTSAWKVLLQQQGVINDILVWLGVISNAGRLALINNQTGTIIAMTHILLPFMILPLYSVMKTIPPHYVRAAKSLGATNWTAFWRVYFPQSVPGIGAGCILVFILSIGYYITPELVGGTTGTFISNRIAYHISTSLNWGLAAALGTILLVVVLVLYYLYDRLVGIDNVSLG
ncbi:ABC transporter permease [Palleronia sp. LCG004]|uniref:ABC transporter permease n=1 Tax=Palleronia sp. LCG004 TaxID=3079304 RepID=UPI002943737B|nr:ABC transporter permease [Palleronia sp. LCG004]WOI55602.1 ABC transporter permease [Palleronia sp. LCG004]